MSDAAQPGPEPEGGAAELEPENAGLFRVDLDDPEGEDVRYASVGRLSLT
ncbi:hypothetical protein [Streptomyces uncialis]|nr:hypothetical protein OG924_36865 [Streptomyces uncialis]